MSGLAEVLVTAGIGLVGVGAVCMFLGRRLREEHRRISVPARTAPPLAGPPPPDLAESMEALYREAASRIGTEAPDYAVRERGGYAVLRCRRCNRESANPHDVLEAFCPKCGFLRKSAAFCAGPVT